MTILKLFFNSCAESPDLFIKNGVAFNIEKSTPSYAGDYAVQLTTKQVGDEVVPVIFKLPTRRWRF